jgi:vancomycin resistance protein YoaR
MTDTRPGRLRAKEEAVNRASWIRIGVIAALAAAGGAGGLVACARWLPLTVARDPGRALPGLRVDGQPVGDRAGDVRALVESRARAVEDRRVRLVVRDGDATRTILESTLGDLGVSVDVDAVTSRALRIGRTEDVLGRARMADRARRGELDVPLDPGIDDRVVVERLLPFKEELDVPPVPARLDLEKHAIVAERDGRALDPDGAAERVERAALDPGVVEIELPFANVPPTVTRESLARIDISHVVASFETYFSRHGDQGPRARNIEVAASHVDGLVIEAGGAVSFNDVVGPRSEENGFRKAFEILKGEMVEGTGGGTCQVASTLHAIAFYGGLDIVQRLPHSRPSGYIPAGLDATVVYPVVDLKLRNPYAFPVVVHATVTANKIKMELLGADKPVEVTFGRSVISTKPFTRKVVEDPGVAKPKRKQKGIDGMELYRARVIVFPDGHKKVEGGRDVYPPTSEIWHVPPGFDESSLPPLGEDLPKEEPPKPQAAM